MLELDSYVATDPYFGRPYVDADDQRDEPVPHRHIHGGFEGTDTRFRFYFPSGDGYEGRMFNPLSGGDGGTEDFFGSPIGESMGGLSMCLRLGGYMIESNQGHIGDEIDSKAGPDASLYGHRASAEVARFSKYVAAQIYGAPPHHSYVFGGSGGGRRSPLCLENAPDVWDGALPFMGCFNVPLDTDPNVCRRFGMNAFGSIFNVQRILGPKLTDVTDATAPGGSGNPFAGLTTHQREELTSLYRQGYPRGSEFMIGAPMGQIWVWTAIADELAERDPDYFENFWSKPGYIGHDAPELVAHDLIDMVVPVARVVTAFEILQKEEFSGPDFAQLRVLAAVFSRGVDLPMAVELEDLGTGYRLGTGVRVVSGEAAGRQLYCLNATRNFLLCDGRGEASNQRFTGVKVGDEVHVDNHRFLAFCYLPRHDLQDELQGDALLLDGRPIYPQHDAPLHSPTLGVAHTGEFVGKMVYLQHTHDSSAWPVQAVRYAEQVLAAQGQKGVAERFRLRWTENAEHGTAAMLPSSPGRPTSTWLIDYQPIVEQSLLDLVAWVEDGVDPAPTNFEYTDGKVILPETAAARGGIQPVVAVSANGLLHAEVRVGESVLFEVRTEAPPGAGTIVSVEWDFDGTGTFAHQLTEVDGTAGDLKLTTDHVYSEPGTYFATARVHAHRNGDVNATSRRVPNVAQVRVTCTA